MIFLDTNVISAVRRPDRAPQVGAWLRGKAEQDLFLSVITLGEVERGKRNIALLNIFKLAETLEVEPSVLFEAPAVEQH